MYVKTPLPPKPIAVPITVAIYTIPAGIPFERAAANIASPNGAIPLIPRDC